MITIKLADRLFDVDNRYIYIEVLCRDYLSQEKGQAVIRVTDEQINAENTSGGSYTQGYLESLAVYRQICERLIMQDVLLFHCSALMIDGDAFLFSAPSGTGKSTHTRLWREYFGDRVTMINDDKPLLEFSGGSVYVHGTPFAGKHNIHTNCSAQVKGIVFLHQAAEDNIRRMSAAEAYPALLNQSYRINDPAGIKKTMDMVSQLAVLPVYSLGCTISHNAVQTAYNALKGTE